MSGYFAIPRDIYTSIKIESRRQGCWIPVAVLSELAFRVRYNGNILDNLAIGQARMGMAEMAKCVGCTIGQVRYALKLLSRLTIVRHASDTRGTTVTFLRSDIYSASEKTNYKPTTNELQLTDSTSTTTKKKGNPRTAKTGEPQPPPQAGRILDVGEIETFIDSLKSNLEISAPLPRGMVAQFLRCFGSKDHAYDWMADVFQRAMSKCEDDSKAALNYIKASMVNHTRVEVAERGN